jgi:hypothetical protein
MDTVNIDISRRTMHLLDLYDMVKSTRNEETYLTLSEISGIFTDVFDEAECERLSELIFPSK